MWQAIFRITDGFLTKQFDLLDVMYLSVGWLLTGVMIGLGEPEWLIYSTMAILLVAYVVVYLVLIYLRNVCLGRVTTTDPIHGGTE